jgi:predicted DNA binding CopG/RHH family protein
MPTTTRDLEGQTSKTTLRLPASLLERAKIRAIKEHRTLQEIVSDAITTYLQTPVSRMRDAS